MPTPEPSAASPSAAAARNPLTYTPVKPAGAIERLFAAYFVEGRFIGDHDELARLAAEAGIDEAAARAWLASEVGRTEIAQAEERARSLGITGVPFFIFDGRVALSGAHPPETIRDAIRQALAGTSA